LSLPRAAPQFSAPRAAAPRVLPHTPRVGTPMPRAGAPSFARPRGGPPASALARPAPRPLAVPVQKRQGIARDLARQRETLPARSGLAQVRRDPTQVSRRLDRSLSQTHQPFRVAAGDRPRSGRVLHNRSFADRSALRNDPDRAFARATFRGSFAGKPWRKHFRHRHKIVIGFIGPLFWPYAYDDFIGYTFYPYAYDTFWPYAYDELYADIFGPYAYGGTAYAHARGSAAPAAAALGGGGRSARARVRAPELCSGQTAGLTDWPIEQIAQTVRPDDAQRAALDELTRATANALEILKAACPSELPSTPTGRMQAMRQRLDAMLQAVRIIRPALDGFYQLLDDEQKARFNAAGFDQRPDQQGRRDLGQVCSAPASGIGSLPIERIELSVQPDGAQRSALQELVDANAQALELLRADCPTYRALTPVGRLEAMEQRLDAMLRAVQLVEPALEKFYGSLNVEQKERFNRLTPAS
jgi:hypothetical protein